MDGRLALLPGYTNRDRPRKQTPAHELQTSGDTHIQIARDRSSEQSSYFEQWWYFGRQQSCF